MIDGFEGVGASWPVTVGIFGIFVIIEGSLWLWGYCIVCLYIMFMIGCLFYIEHVCIYRYILDICIIIWIINWIIIWDMMIDIL